MKRIIAILFALFASIFAGADTLSISDCYKMARDNYPMIKQFDLIKEAKQFDIENATHGYTICIFALVLNIYALSSFKRSVS